MKALIVGGGTGGHIYPGIAIAEELQKRNIDNKILFIGSDDGLEREIVPKERFSLKTISARRILRKLSLASITAPFASIRAFLQARSHIKEFAPDIVISTGGYVSFPVVVAARTLGVPVLIHEQNTIPGITNRICRFFAKKITVSYPQTVKFFPRKKTTLTGNPIREKVIKTLKSVGRQKLNLDQKRRTILVLGGSQGARKINEAVADMIDFFSREGIQVLHVTGTRDYDMVVSKTGHKVLNIDGEIPFVKGRKKHITLAKYKLYHAIPYMYNVWDGIAAADIVISRAGATALAEITAKGIPSILVPFPFSAERHQDHNAEVLKNAGACILIDNGQLTAEALELEIRSLFSDPAKLEAMKEAALKLSYPDAAKRIADLIYDSLGIFAAKPKKTARPRKPAEKKESIS